MRSGTGLGNRAFQPQQMGASSTNTSVPGSICGLVRGLHVSHMFTETGVTGELHGQNCGLVVLFNKILT